MSKVTVSAPANIALIKYWGALDLEHALPRNPSLSLTLEESRAITTAEVIEGSADVVLIRNDAGHLEEASPDFARPIHRHLERLRVLRGEKKRLRIATRNTFPSDAGLASSAAGFCALALAVSHALGRPPTQDELSVLARESGSGSAARSAFGGFVTWPSASDKESPARQIATADHWPLHDVIAVVDTKKKAVSSREGHRRAPSSAHFAARQAGLGARFAAVQHAVLARDFAALTPHVEEEAIELHLIAMSSHPPIFYWTPGTLAVLKLVRDLRGEGLELAATMDAGPNVHILCPPEAGARVRAAVEALEEVQTVLHDRCGFGPRLEEEPLF